MKKNKEKARLLQDEQVDGDEVDSESRGQGYQLRIHIIEARELKGRYVDTE